MKSGWIKMFGGLIPADQTSKDWLDKTKHGQFVEVEITRPRNWQFHKKYFALLNFAFENWDIPNDSAAKNFEKFRGDLIIMAGFYEKVWSPNGEMRLYPKSISFANMEEQEFQELYSKTVSIILEKVLTTYTEDDITKALNALAGFM